MANPYPSLDEVKAIRQDVEDYVVDNKEVETDYTPEALKRIKRYLEDKRGILWVQVWDEDNSDYFVGADDVARNRDKIIDAIGHMVVALVFKDWSIKRTEGMWWDLYVSYRADAEDSLRNARLDIDRDESGAITEDETAKRSQPFVRR